SNDPKLMSLIGVGEEGPVLTLRSGGLDRAAIAVVNGQPSMSMKNDKGVPIVQILQSPRTGSGELQLGDPAGNAMVEAGVTDTGRGLVRAYPLGTSGAGLFGLPGTYILGRTKQGE